MVASPDMNSSKSSSSTTPAYQEEICDKLIQLSFAKIVNSKSERGGARLHKNLLILHLLQKARTEQRNRFMHTPMPMNMSPNRGGNGQYGQQDGSSSGGNTTSYGYYRTYGYQQQQECEEQMQTDGDAHSGEEQATEEDGDEEAIEIDVGQQAAASHSSTTASMNEDESRESGFDGNNDDDEGAIDFSTTMTTVAPAADVKEMAAVEAEQSPAMVEEHSTTDEVEQHSTTTVDVVQSPATPATFDVQLATAHDVPSMLAASPNEDRSSRHQQQRRPHHCRRHSPRSSSNKSHRIPRKHSLSSSSSNSSSSESSDDSCSSSADELDGSKYCCSSIIDDMETKSRDHLKRKLDYDSDSSSSPPSVNSNHWFTGDGNEQQHDWYTSPKMVCRHSTADVSSSDHRPSNLNGLISVLESAALNESKVCPPDFTACGQPETSFVVGQSSSKPSAYGQPPSSFDQSDTIITSTTKSIKPSTPNHDDENDQMELAAMRIYDPESSGGGDVGQASSLTRSLSCPVLVMELACES